MRSKQLLFILQQAPYVDDRPLETLDALLVAAAFEQTVSVLFRGAGVAALLPEQAPVNQRNVAKVLKSLQTYEVDAVYADAAAMSAAGLAPAHCVISPELLDADDITALIARHDMVMSG